MLNLDFAFVRVDRVAAVADALQRGLTGSAAHDYDGGPSGAKQRPRATGSRGFCSLATAHAVSIHHGLTTACAFAVALLFAAAGCKPSSSNTGQASPPVDRSALRQPTAKDFQAFFQSLLPASVHVSEIKIDAPTRMSDSPPNSNAWLLSTKITLTPAEDLLSLPSTEDAQAVNDSMAELNALVAWRNVYINSPYARTCGACEFQVPTSPLPQLLVVTQHKDQPLPPIYTKVSAEWQVDHWHFEPANDNSEAKMPDVGKLRSDFTGATMIKGTPEAEKVLREVRDAITQARKAIDATRGRYAAQVSSGTKPGAVYTGKVSYGSNIAPCELRFLDPPPGADAHFASFQLTLSGQNPPCWYVYKARVVDELPIPVPGAQPSSANTNPAIDFDPSNRVPQYNISQNLVRSSNFKVGRDTLASWLGSNDHGGQGLLALNGHIEGLISDFGNPGIRLSVQQKP